MISHFTGLTKPKTFSVYLQDDWNLTTASRLENLEPNKSTCSVKDIRQNANPAQKLVTKNWYETGGAWFYT